MLDAEEKEIVAAFEADELVPVADMGAAMEQHRKVAAETLKKDKRITIRISSRDLEGLRKRAIVEGIPYQTLVASVLHKYVNGRFAEKPYSAV